MEIPVFCTEVSKKFSSAVGFGEPCLRGVSAQSRVLNQVTLKHPTAQKAMFLRLDQLTVPVPDLLSSCFFPPVWLFGVLAVAAFGQIQEAYSTPGILAKMSLRAGGLILMDLL